MEQFGPPLKKLCLVNRASRPQVAYMKFSLPHKYPSRIEHDLRINPNMQGAKKIMIVNPTGKKINLGTKTISKLRIKDKNGTDLGEVNATHLNINKLNGNHLINKPIVVDKKATPLTLSTPDGLYGMLIPIEKRAGQQMPTDNTTVIYVQPSLPKSNEKPKEINKCNKANELITVATKSLQHPQKSLTKNVLLKTYKNNNRVSKISNIKSPGIVKQKINYFQISNAQNDRMVKQKEPDKKKLTANNNGNAITHNTSDISAVNNLYLIKPANEKKKEFSADEKKKESFANEKKKESSVNEKKEAPFVNEKKNESSAKEKIKLSANETKKESSGKEEKIIKESKSLKTIILKGAIPGVSTPPVKNIRLIKIKKLTQNSTSPEVKLPTLQLNKIAMNQLFTLFKTTKESMTKNSNTSNKTIESNKDVHTNSTTEEKDINNVKNSVPTALPTEICPEKRIEDKTNDEAEKDIVIVYEKKREDPPSAPDLENEINVSDKSHSMDKPPKHIDNNEINTIAKKSVPPNDDEERTIHTIMPLKYDENIRKIALLALTECRTNKIQQIKNNCPERYKEVQTQTDIFALLNENSFVSIDEPIEPIKQTESEQVVKSPVACEAQVQTEQVELQQEPKSSTNYVFDNMDLISAWNLSPVPRLEEVHNYFETGFKSNEEADKVKKVLSIPQNFCKRVATQLEKDYEEMQSWDENGLLNIHRAVIDDDLRRLKRLLLVLEASKTNIDIRTEDGMTSLELAIKYSSSQGIVELLLKAGAQPITSEFLHESAIILASRLSSPSLPLLLNYVKEHELLNQVDSSGSTPLHYCAMNGNIDGLNALLSKKVDVNIRDERSGRTAFFHAVENDHMKIAQRLIQSGGIADIPNFSGQSVMALVDETKGLSLMPVLRDLIFQLPC